MKLLFRPSACQDGAVTIFHSVLRVHLKRVWLLRIFSSLFFAALLRISTMRGITCFIKLCRTSPISWYWFTFI